MREVLKVLHVPVVFGQSDLRRWLKGQSKVVILTDKVCEQACLPHLLEANPRLQAAPVLAVPGTVKSIESFEWVLGRLMEVGADRHTLLVTLGGGSVGDLGAFVASVYKRGMPCLNIPTTLLAMSDSCVGGKTAVDYGGVRNLIGTYKSPLAVVVDVSYLRRLPAEVLADGYSEVIKHACLSAGLLWQWVTSEPGEMDLEWMIEESLRVKKGFVEADPQDDSLRRSLNFGHTTAHALEAVIHITHGKGLAVGLLAETSLSVSKSGLKQERADQIQEAVLRWCVLPNIEHLDKSAIEHALRHDKKNQNSQLQLTLLEDIGTPKINVDCTAAEVSAAIERILQLCPVE
jgi:3-dehydroquinate synthase